MDSEDASSPIDIVEADEQNADAAGEVALAGREERLDEDHVHAWHVSPAGNGPLPQAAALALPPMSCYAREVATG